MITPGIYLPSEIAQALCAEIERFPACEKQTELSLKAAELRAALVQHEQTRALGAEEKALIARGWAMLKSVLPPVVHDYNVGEQYFRDIDLNNPRATLPFLASSGDQLRIRERTRDDIAGKYTGRERWAEISNAEKHESRTVCRLTELNGRDEPMRSP